MENGGIEMKAICKIYAIGNSLGITVNGYVLDRMKLKEGDMVEVEFKGKV